MASSSFTAWLSLYKEVLTVLVESVTDLCLKLMIPLSGVDDCKEVLGLFSTVYKMSKSQSVLSFPRLGQMVIDYNLPLKKLSEEFVLHTRTLTHTFLSHEAAMELWTLALNSSWTTVFYRDEVIYTHSNVQTYFESIKGYGKKVN